MSKTKYVILANKSKHKVNSLENFKILVNELRFENTKGLNFLE